jgi:hypothetical protein
MARWIKFAALVFAFALTVYLTSYISRLPEANCTTGPVSSLWSGDHLYKATLLKKDCNLYETTFYSVRIDKPDAWFLRVEIEEDPYPAQASEPAMKWDLHKLEIDIPAEHFSGSIARREGDLTVERTYVSPKPQN